MVPCASCAWWLDTQKYMQAYRILQTQSQSLQGPHVLHVVCCPGVLRSTSECLVILPRQQNVLAVDVQAMQNGSPTDMCC